jgi:hypothetical protein
VSEHDHHTSEQIGAAIRAAAAQVSAPAELRVRVARDRLRSAPRHRPRLRPAALIAGGSALAVVVVALVIALAPGSPGAPSVADAAGVALSMPTRPAPGTDIVNPRFIEANVAGVRFPNYAYDASWRTVGGRSDTIGRRRSQTVAYARGPVRVGYTIVDGRPLQAPQGARWANAAGTSVRVMRLDGALVVTWERGRHTCVLASRTATLPQMLRLVAWRDDA